MYNIPHGGFFKKGAETAKRKCNAGTSKWRQIGDVTEIAKDYRTDVYWGGEVVLRLPPFSDHGSAFLRWNLPCPSSVL